MQCLYAWASCCLPASCTFRKRLGCLIQNLELGIGLVITIHECAEFACVLSTASRHWQSLLHRCLAAADADCRRRDTLTPGFITSVGALALLALTTTLAPAGVLCNTVCSKNAPYGMHGIPDQLFHRHSSVSLSKYSCIYACHAVLGGCCSYRL